MTVTQIGILAGAALLALTVIGVAVLFIFISAPLSSQAQPAPATDLPTLTASPTIPLVDDTPTPTPAPIIATSLPPGGWVEFKTKNATLWLPAGFVGGDMLAGKQETINKVTRLGRYYKNVVSIMKSAAKETVLFMVDKTPMVTDIITTVMVTHYMSPEGDTLDEYIKNQMASSDSDGTPTAMKLAINQNKKLTVLGREARRLTVSTMFTGHEAVGILYFIKDGATVWVVDYTLSTNQYVDMLATAEESIQTFNLIP